VHPEDLIRIKAAIERAKESRERFAEEHRCILPDTGDVRWLSLDGRFSYDETGTPLRFSGVSMDITERKQAEEAFAERQRTLKTVTDNATLALFIMDARQQCVFMNPAAQELTGYTLAEAQGRPLHDVVHHTRPDGRPYPLTECPIDQAFPTQNRMQGEEVFVHKDGRFYTVAFTASPLRDEGGAPVGTIIEVQDITERKQSEAALQVSEQRLQRVLETDAVGILFFDQSGSVIQANDVFLRLTGYRREQIEHRELTWRRMTPSEWVEVSETQLKQFAQSGRIGPYEQEYFMADGSRRWMLFAGRDLGDGTIVEYCVDIHERKRAECALYEAQQQLQRWNIELEQAVNEKTAALQESEARLRALASQLNLAEQRERKRLATELHDHLQQMLVYGKMTLGQGKRQLAEVPTAVEVMTKVDDVLSDALTYNRTLVAELSPPVLRDHGLAAALKWLAEYMAQKHEQTVTMIVPEDDRLLLPEDQCVLLFQSVRELLINASKHAGTGAATVEMITRQDQVTIQVRDEGIGFDLAAAAGTPGGGISSKFGLFSIQERMRALGGLFDIQSSPGKGTTATLVLPVAKRTEDSGLASLSRSGRRTGLSESDGSSLSPQSSALQKNAMVRVLLVDDHAMVREGLRSVLDAYDDLHVVAEAGDGAEAVKLVEDLHPRVVVMDINMPRMNGIEATTHIKTRWPETTIIGISINAGDDNSNAMKRVGAATVLPKDMAVDELYQTILQVLKT
jgi:PAS domain S-box-containing protein